MLGEHLELNSKRRSGLVDGGQCGGICCVYVLRQVKAISGKQTSLSSPYPARTLKKFKFYLIIHISFNNSSSSHLVRVAACCQAAENTVQCAQLGQMLALFFVIH